MDLKPHDKVKVLGFNCGTRARRRLICMGIKHDKILEIIAIQPYGPITVKVGNTQVSIGRMLFDCITWELLDSNR